MTVPSPCVDICRMDASRGWCEGCLRSIDEIVAWSRLDDAGKRAVWALLPARHAAVWGDAAPPAEALPPPPLPAVPPR